MKRFVWSETYSLGIPEIDEQHRSFFDITNQVLGLSERRELTAYNLLRLTDQLDEYAAHHFDLEEGYFRKFGYADAERHIESHGQFRARLKELTGLPKESMADIEKLAAELGEFAVGWLTKHIMEMDRRYATLFRENGLDDGES